MYFVNLDWIDIMGDSLFRYDPPETIYRNEAITIKKHIHITTWKDTHCIGDHLFQDGLIQFISINRVIVPRVVFVDHRIDHLHV